MILTRRLNNYPASLIAACFQWFKEGRNMSSVSCSSPVIYDLRPAPDIMTKCYEMQIYQIRKTFIVRMLFAF